MSEKAFSDAPSLRESPRLRPDLSSLIARVEAAEGAVLLSAKEAYDAMIAMGSDAALGDAARLRIALTGSIDAALALVERVLPGVAVKLHVENGRGLYGAVATLIEPPTKWGGRQHEEFGKTPALAIVLALLRALQEQT